MQGNIFSTIAPEVCERLMGAPDQAGATDLRWGRRGSFRLLLQSGSWHDYENGERGGVLDLIQRELRIDKESSIQWLRSEGLLLSSKFTVTYIVPCPVLTLSVTP